MGSRDFREFKLWGRRSWLSRKDKGEKGRSLVSFYFLVVVLVKWLSWRKRIDNR